jgi:uncharacterized protein YceK
MRRIWISLTVLALLQGCSTTAGKLEQAKRDYIDNKITQEEYYIKEAALKRGQAESQERWRAVAAGLSAGAQSMNQQTSSTSYPVEPLPVTPTPRPALDQSLGWVEGASIVASDGTFLGRITVNSFVPDSIGNELGKHGSSLSTVSIFNDLGQYGSRLSNLSPWNELSSSPPKVITSNGRQWAYLTANKFLSPRIDPYVLVAYVHSK